MNEPATTDTAHPEVARAGATSHPPGGSATSGMTVEIVVPVYNEERDLPTSIRRLRHYLDREFPFPATITIADNASTDATWHIATELAAADPTIRAIHLGTKGRGRALKAAWLASSADVLAYMDVDLSTGLNALLPLVAPLISGHSEVAIGSRLASGSRVVRGAKREFISRGYNHLLHAVLRSHVTDAQCGFKAIRADVARTLLPWVEDGAWFFDTELLALAERRGLRIHEVPVDWVDDPDSRVEVLTTSIADLKGIWRLSRAFAGGRARLEPPTPRSMLPPPMAGQTRWPFPAAARLTVWAVAAVLVVALSMHLLAPSHPAGVPGPSRTPAQGA